MKKEQKIKALLPAVSLTTAARGDIEFYYFNKALFEYCREVRNKGKGK